METSSEDRRTRRIRMPQRWWTRALLVSSVFAVLVAPAAWANHQFSDVPAASPHHAAVSALFGARITGGCAPGLYCPASNVRRDEMASFLQRGLGRNGASGSTAGIALTGTFQDIAQDSITAGGTTGGSGFVMLFGSFTAINRDVPFLTTGIRVEFRFVEDDTGFLSNVSSTTLDPANAVFPSSSAAKQWVFSIPTGTTRTYSLQARITGVSTTSPITAESRLLSLLYVPFGSTGGSTLSGTLGTTEAPPEHSGDAEVG
jgi:hypothetical protein